MSEGIDLFEPRAEARQPPPPRPEDRIPDRCPHCGDALLTIEDVTICPSCGFRSDHPLAGRLREIDIALARLAWERSDVIDRIRRDSGAAPRPATLRTPPTTPRRSPSVQAVLVALGAFLVVVASVIFAVVTWEQLGATGQALVLMVATATAAGVTVAAARARLTATAEALAVVAAGLAFLDVHAARIAVAPDDPWQIVWAVGVAVVAVGLLAFGRAVGLRGPAIVAVTAGQLPLALLASLADRAGLAVAAALVTTAALDLLAAKKAEAEPRRWLPTPAPMLLGPFGATTWAMGVIVATAWAMAGETLSSRWLAVGVLVGATAVSAIASWRGRAGDPLEIAAAAGTVLAGLLAVIGTGRQIIDDDTLLLLSNASAVAVLAGSWAVSASVHRTVPARSDVDTRGTDPRLVAGTVVAAAWAGFSLLPWAGPVLGAILAPLAVLADDGWWSQGLWVTTGELDLEPLPGQAENLDPPSAGLVLAAVAVGTVGLVTAIRLVGRRPSVVGRTVTALVIGAGVLSAVAVIGAGWDVPVVTLVVAYLLAAVVPLSGALRSGFRHGSWLAVGALPIAAAAVAWAGIVQVLTVFTLGTLTVLGALVVARSIAKQRRSLARAATAVTGIALAATAATIGLALGVADSTAWILALSAGAVGSSAAWLGDRWAPWWSPALDITSVAVVGTAVAGLAVTGGPDPLSIGVLIIVVTAAAHTTRPSRRALAGLITAVAALILWWLQAWTADLRVVEVYSLPAAAVAGGIGWWQLRRRPELGSWPTLGPALLIAAIPSVAVAVTEPGVLRPLLVLVVAAVATVAGTRLRLRAPFALGALTAVIIAVDQLFPTVARLPRWTVIGTVGILLLVVGATFERQRRRVAGLYERYRQLR